MKNAEQQKEALPTGFTLPELLVAVSIFVIVAVIVSNMYSRAFRIVAQSNRHAQIYADARFIMRQIEDEVSAGMIDYDEYYNQDVVQGNFGQNYGKYYSAFFNPGTDEGRLGFDCNDGGLTPRNSLECETPLRLTIDRNTGENPFTGKTQDAGVTQDSENAMCGTVGSGLNQTLANRGQTPDGRDSCDDGGTGEFEGRIQPELYIISRDGMQKTILARERINRTAGTPTPIYALSMLRMQGYDTNSDGVPDSFQCAEGFRCTGGTADCSAGELPRSRAEELANETPDTCDTDARGYSDDFVPISPLRVNVSNLTFYISPLENPYYAFAETAMQQQPRVTIVLTVEPNNDFADRAEQILPITLVDTATPQVVTRIPTPLLVE